MKDLVNIKKSMIIVEVVWQLSLLFSAIMLTLALMFEENIALYVSIVCGLISCIGIFYTGNIVIRVENLVEKVANK